MSPEKEQVTVMILYVDLKCSCCYKKVRKLLCKFPQIRDQVFDEDKNKVRITVVCCDPEKFRDKLCCKGGKAIQSIEIVEPEPPKPPSKPPPPADPPKPKPIPIPAVIPVPIPQPEKKPEPKPQPQPEPVKKPNPIPVAVPQPKPPEPVKKPQPQPEPVKKPEPAPQPAPVNMPVPMPMPMPMPMDPFCPPVSVCCQECYEGRGGGPCNYLYGRPVPPPPGPCYDGYGYGYGSRPPCYVRCDYFSEENPQGCSIM